jgi:hypothetical protein
VPTSSIRCRVSGHARRQERRRQLRSLPGLPIAWIGNLRGLISTDALDSEAFPFHRHDQRSWGDRRLKPSARLESYPPREIAAKDLPAAVRKCL